MRRTHVQTGDKKMPLLIMILAFLFLIACGEDASSSGPKDETSPKQCVYTFTESCNTDSSDYDISPAAHYIDFGLDTCCGMSMLLLLTEEHVYQEKGLLTQEEIDSLLNYRPDYNNNIDYILAMHEAGVDDMPSMIEKAYISCQEDAVCSNEMQKENADINSRKEKDLSEISRLLTNISNRSICSSELSDVSCSKIEYVTD